MSGWSIQKAAGEAGRPWNSSRFAATMSGCARSTRHARTIRHIDEGFRFARQPEPRGLALEQGLERLAIRHAFVDLHVGRRIVATPQPSSLDLGLCFYLAEQIPNRERNGFHA